MGYAPPIKQETAVLIFSHTASTCERGMSIYIMATLHPLKLIVAAHTVLGYLIVPNHTSFSSATSPHSNLNEIRRQLKIDIPEVRPFELVLKGS